MVDWPISNNQKDRIIVYCVQLPNTSKIHNVFYMSHLHLYTTDNKEQFLPLLIFEEDVSYEVDYVLSSEEKGLVLTRKNYVSLNDLDMHLNIISWEPDNNLSVEVLKEYWDVVAKFEDMLTCHGVKHD